MPRMQPANAKATREARGAVPFLATPERLPRSRQLRLDLLHTFEAAARHLSFTSAGGREAQVPCGGLERVQQVQPELARARQAFGGGQEGHRAACLAGGFRIRWLHAWHAESPLVAGG